MIEKVRHFESLKEAVSSMFGDRVRVESMSRISGGDINEAFGLSLSDGHAVFMKRNRKENLNFFFTEVMGLSAIRSTGTVCSPEVLCTGTDENHSFLLLEFIRGKNRISGYWETFARELALMHQADTKDFVTGERFGFIKDNYIGASKQINTAHEKFVDFFRDCRLEPQIRNASHYLSSTDLKKAEQLLSHLDKYLTEPEQPSLLHGDMWSGNVITGNDGKVWLIDPAAYVGHAEADIAMTELFGRLPADFYEAYTETGLIQPGYADRRELYNLYHLLNHLNLFGSGYLHSVRGVLNHFV